MTIDLICREVPGSLTILNIVQCTITVKKIVRRTIVSNAGQTVRVSETLA